LSRFHSLLIALCAVGVCSGQNIDNDAGQRQFANTCSLCHGGDGMGGELGPAIAGRLRRLDDQQLTTLIHQGLPSRGMPAFPNLTGASLANLIGFVRTLSANAQQPLVRRSIETTTGTTLEGTVLNQSMEDLGLQTNDGRIHLLRAAGARFREVTSQSDWPTYNGDFNGNRYTKLTQIDKSNVSRLVPKWTFAFPGAAFLEMTPVVVEGIMYATNGNECYALDAGNGRVLWHFKRPRTKGVTGGGASGINRGVAWKGDRIFMVTDNAHLLALNRYTGRVEWDIEMADWHQNYNATSAPLVVGDLVISGSAGGEEGARGFLAAFSVADGKEAWRFWTVPGSGEPGAETWKGNAREHGGAVAWFTGSYDAQLDTLYWQTGNPDPEYNGAEREGDNLYSDSVLALEAKTGKLKWYYQFTPHDLHDWDASEPLLLVDTAWHGRERKLLLQANRNGFFYVFDRTNGELLLTKQFVHKMNWAKEIGPDRRPVLLPLPKVPGGTHVCPSQDGATNWFSTSFLPSTGLYYLQSLEKCNIYSQGPAVWEAGQNYLGGSQRPVPGEVPQKILRAIDIQSGKSVWELPQIGGGDTWGGTLATATGLLFFGEDSGTFMAVDAANGKPLWRFHANQMWKASPMTYQFDGKQHVAIATGQTVTSFALLD
jgi:alcohol dehydrogenase (cytochrome c)